MTAESIEIYRSPNRKSCEERAFVLTAVGVPYEMSQSAEGFSLWVDLENLERARDHLLHYQQESRRPPPPAPVDPAPVPARLGGQRRLRTGAAGRRRGGESRLRPPGCIRCRRAQCRTGAPWTVVACLDSVDLASGCGAHRRQYRRRRLVRLSGRTAARTRHRLGAGGPGRGCANWVEALLAAADHRAVGASTAVFTALGMLAAYSWRERQCWPAPGAPLWSAVRAASSCWVGWAHPVNTRDIMAHLLGFAVGGVLGAADRRRPRATPVAPAASMGRRHIRTGGARAGLGLRIAHQFDITLRSDGRAARSAVDPHRTFPVSRLVDSSWSASSGTTFSCQVLRSDSHRHCAG